MKINEAHSLAKWLDWVGIGNCLCNYAYTNSGILYGISIGKGWHRQDTNPNCAIHSKGAK